MSDTNNDAIINKIEKLLRLSKSENEHEAAVAADMASKLMTEHQIAFSQLTINESKAENIVQERQKGGDDKPALAPWAVRLADWSARMFDARVFTMTYTYPKRRVDIVWVGLPSDVKLARALFDHLFDAEQSAARAALSVERKRVSYDREWTSADSKMFNRDFGDGFSTSIANKINQAIIQRKAAVTASSDTGRALVVVKDKLVDDHLSTLGLGRARPRQVRYSDAYYTGRKAGEQTGLSTGRLTA